MLPEHCPLCNGTRKGTPVSLKSEPWHWLTCHSLMGGSSTAGTMLWWMRSLAWRGWWGLKYNGK